MNAPADQAARDTIRREVDRTLVVEAGAGTGKTSELVHRIVALVLRGAQLREIAAITFTDAAAAELRDRVRLALEAGAAAAGHESGAAVCAEALAQIDEAPLLTIHALAHRILARHAVAAGLPPRFTVRDETEASIALDAWWSDVLRRADGDREIEEMLGEAVALGLTANHLQLVARSFRSRLDLLPLTAFEPPPATPVDVGPVLAAVDKAVAGCEGCHNPADAMHAFVHGELAAWRRRLVAASSDADAVAALLAAPFNGRGRTGRQDNWSPGGLAEVRALLAAGAEAVSDALWPPRQRALARICAWLRFEVEREAQRRRVAGELEFDDLLLLARDLLRDDVSVRRAVRAEVAHLLVDEFQDTDPLQVELAFLVAGGPEESERGWPGWEAAEVPEGRLFFVGDPKQSIYRFRRADVSLYERVSRRFEAARVVITESFRSAPAVLGWVNTVFGFLMGRQEGQARWVDLVASREERGGLDANVLLLGGAAEGSIASIREREAVEVAAMVVTAVEDGWLLEDRATGDWRPARFSDVCLLLPGRTTLPAMERALAAAGVPFRVEARSLVWDTQEVRDLLAVLRAADDGSDQVALVAALRSPLLACSDDDLLRWAELGGRWSYLADGPEVDHPVGRALAVLAGLHERRWAEPVSAFVERVVRERRALQLAYGHARPRESWRRVSFLVEQARAFCDRDGGSLRAFVEWAERQAEERAGAVESIVPEEDDDAVRIMTIHAAKGLEFPIVVLAGLNSKGAPPGPARVLWDAAGAPAVRIGARDVGWETPNFAEVEAEDRRLSEQEQVRLLYVAATRARDHLVVSLHHKRGQGLAALLEEPCAGSERYAPDPRVHSARNPHVMYSGLLPAPAWEAERRETLAAALGPQVRAATGFRPDDGLDEADGLDEDGIVRRGRAGTAFGRAVHAVLQTADLATGQGIDAAATAQAAGEGVAHRAAEIAGAVGAVIRAPVVREAVASGRMWREVYVGTASVEGFVDLLFEGPSGLAVVDYKTDTVRDERQADETAARYRQQVAAYAVALEEALGRPVDRGVLVFALPGGAVEREITDLPAAKAEVRAELSGAGRPR